MTALPTSNALDSSNSTLLNIRGTIGADNNNTTYRVENELLIHAILNDLRFWVPEWFVQATIPLHQNELLYFNIQQRGSGAVYELNEAGRKLSDGTEVPSITLNEDNLTMVLKLYGSIYRYTQRQIAVAKRNPLDIAATEQGIIIAQQMDALVKSLLDTGSQDVYPAAAVTSDADADWDSTMTFDYPLILRLETMIMQQGLRPIKGQKRFPFVLPVDAQTNLLLDPTIAAILNATAVRKDPMADIYLSGFLGSLRCFDFYVSNALPVNISLKSGALTGARGYILTDEFAGCASLEDPEYDLPNNAFNTTGSASAPRWTEWDGNPRPVHMIETKPDHASMANAFRTIGAVAEKHAVGFKTLVVGRALRVTFVNGVTGSGSLGLAAAPSLVQV